MRLGPVLLLSLAACGDRVPPGVVDDCEAPLTPPASIATDILFVIDDSGSMAEEQARVADELGRFVLTLLEAPVEHDFQVGVISTSVTRNATTCGGGEPQLDEYDGAGVLRRARNLDGTEVDASGPRLLHRDDPDFLEEFRALVRQGTAGSGQEMPLEAVRRALTPPLAEASLAEGGNEGFLRVGTRLLVVIVTDEDDCSDPTGTAVTLAPPCGEACTEDADCGGQGVYCVLDGGARRCAENRCETPEGLAAIEPVDRYVEFFDSLEDGTGRRREVSLAVIGPFTEEGAPARCRSATDEAYGAGVRLREVVDAFGARGLSASICSADYGAALEEIAALIATPQVLTLDDAPSDGRLLNLTIRRGGASVECRQGDGFTYERDGDSARLQLEGDCRLLPGDELELRQFCAG